MQQTKKISNGVKILQVNKLYYPWIGGVEKVVQQIAEGLNGKDNFEIEVLSCQPKGKAKVEDINGLRVYKSSSWGMFLGMPFSLNFFSLFKKLSREAGIIALHHPFPLADLAVFLFPPAAKLIVHYHSDIVRQRIFNFFLRPFALNTLRKAQKIIISNPNMLKSSPLLKRFQEKCRIIPYGVDLPEIERAQNGEEVKKIKQKYGRFILFAGRLSYYKGVHYLISAVQDITANLVIIGEGKRERFLRKMVKDLKIENRVFFLPHQEKKKLINFYKATEVFVLPSIFKSEAFGIVLIEAMASGTPIISTELGTGTSWLNVDGETGFVVPPRSPSALSSAIKKILENKKLAVRLSQNAQKRVKEKLNLEKMLKDNQKVYREL